LSTSDRIISAFVETMHSGNSWFCR